MDYATLFGAILGSAGLFGLIQFLITRHDKKNDRLKVIEKKIDGIAIETKRNELATTRLQLMWLIKTQPTNKDAILNTAQRYFIDLDGDGEAWTVFHKWADARKLNTTWYQMLIKKEERSSHGTHK